MASPRTGTFLRNLRATGLVDDARVDEIASSPHAADDRALARELVKRKLLTRFQAEQILGGRTQGFFIGPYVVLDKIGAGGMGQVYKARHRRMKRTVALKVLPKSSRGDPEVQARFMREVQASAQLIHPNIVTAFDVGEEGDITYLAMEYIQGQDLYHLIHSQGHLEPAGAANIAYQVALALAHAHEHGIVHRDIKPSNILVTDKGVAKVLDMGLARIEHAADDESSRLTSEGVVMGTLDYIAPEQANDTHHADIRADIYSLGCALYHMLTGQVPFPGGGPTEKLCAHAMKSPDDPSALVPAIPSDLSAVMTRMMAKRPEDRYQTPTEVATALLPWVGPAAAPSLSAVSPGPSPGPPPGVAQPPSAVSPGPSPGLPPGVAQPPPAVSPGPAPPSLPSVSDDTISRPAPPAPPPPSTMSAQALAGLQVHGLGRKGRVSRLIVRAESMHTHWRALHQALKAKRVQPDKVADLTQSLRTDYKHLPHILDPVGAPGRTVMSLIQSGATASELRAQTADLERGQQYLHEFVDFLKAVLRRLNEKSVLSYQAGVIIDFLKERKAKPASTLIAAGCVVVGIFLLSLIPGRKLDKPPSEPPQAAVAGKPDAPEPAQISVVQPPAPVTPASDFPVVRADGSGKGPYKTLKEAFADVKADEDVVIELRTNGALWAPGVPVSCQSLTLRGGEGFRPMLLWSSRQPPANGVMLSALATRSVLIEGLHIQSFGAKLTAIYTTAPVVRIRGGTFRGVTVVRTQSPTREIVLRDCFFQDAYVAYPYMDAGRLELSNCAGRVGMAIQLTSASYKEDRTGRVDMVLSHSTLLVMASEGCSLLQLCRGAKNFARVTFQLDGNILLGTADGDMGALVTIGENYGPTDPPVEEWRRAVRVAGRGNRIGGCSRLVQAVRLGRDKRPAYTTVVQNAQDFVKSWAPALEDTRWACAPAPYKAADAGPAGFGLSHVQRVHAALPAGAGDVGADLSRIPEPPVIDKEGNVIRPGKPPTNPRPKESGTADRRPAGVSRLGPGTRTESASPLPIHRADSSGKGPYKTLKEAFADIGKDEDVVIELRTSTVLPTAGLKLTCRTLALQAGPGFRPVLQILEGQGEVMFHVQANLHVHVDGLHFVGTSQTATKCLCVQAPRVRITRCTLQKRPTDNGVYPVCALGPGGVGELRVEDCFFANGMGAGVIVNNAAVHVREVILSNCAGSTATAVCLRTPTAGRVSDITHVRLSRNTLWCHDLFQLVRTEKGHSVPKRVTIDMEGNVLRCVGFVAIRGPSDENDPRVAEWKGAVRWQGEKNLVTQCSRAVQSVEWATGKPTVDRTVVRDFGAFLTSWAPGLKNTSYRPIPPVRVDDQEPRYARRLWEAIARYNQSVPAGFRDVGADLSRIPEPPEIDASGKVIRPGKAPERPRASDVGKGGTR